MLSLVREVDSLINSLVQDQEHRFDEESAFPHARIASNPRNVEINRECIVCVPVNLVASGSDMRNRDLLVIMYWVESDYSTGKCGCFVREKGSMGGTHAEEGKMLCQQRAREYGSCACAYYGVVTVNHLRRTMLLKRSRSLRHHHRCWDFLPSGGAGATSTAGGGDGGGDDCDAARSAAGGVADAIAGRNILIDRRA